MRIERAWVSKPFWRLAGLAFIVAAVVVGSQFLPVRDGIQLFTDWAAQRGFAGMVLFGAAYVLATVLCFWGALFTIAAGVGFGLWWGILISWVSATIGAAMAFLIARHMARGVVETWAQRSDRFSTIDDAIGRHGWRIVLLLRLNPVIPFNLSNYAFGLTRIGFWPYLFASVAGMLPGTAVYTYLGHIGKVTLAEKGGEVGPARYMMLVGGLVLMVAATVYVAWLAKRVSPENREPAEPESPA